MQMRLFKILSLFFIIGLFSGCDPIDVMTEDEEPPPAEEEVQQDSSLVYEDLVFTTDKPYFSTNVPTDQPINEFDASQIIEQVDITYIYSHSYLAPGFMDPVTRAQEWYWDDHYQPWLASANSVTYYYPINRLDLPPLSEIRENPGVFEEIFTQDLLQEVSNPIFPEGSCFGGRAGESGGVGKKLRNNRYVFFKNNTTGRRGLIYVRTDQDQAWLFWISDTRVDLIVEAP